MHEHAKKHKSKIPAILIAVALLLATVAGFAFVQFNSDEYQFTDKTNPLNVKVTLTNESASKDISGQGGFIQLDGSEGGEMTLTLAKDSLFESKKLSLTRIDSLSGMNKDWELVSGAQVGPDGTSLVNRGMLKINIPGGMKSDKLVGFSYEGDGKNFSFYPVYISNNTAVFALDSFSGYGIISIGDSDETPPQPSTIEKQAKQYIAQILKSVQRDLAIGLSDGLDDDQLRRIGNILKGWFDASVKQKLTAAEKNPDLVEDAAHEYLSWLQTVQAMGLDERFAEENEFSLNSLTRAIKNAVDKTVDKCISEKDPSQISRLLHYYKLATILGLDGRLGLTIEAIKTRALRLASFELKISELIHIKYPQYSDDIFSAELTGSGSVPLELDDNFMLSGQGNFSLNKVNTHINVPNNIPITDMASALAYGFTEMVNGDRSEPFNEAYSLEVPPVSLDMSPGAKQVALCFSATYAGGEEPLWQELFGKCHASERVGNLFKISGWNVSGKGAVFASKSYSRNTQIEGLDIKEDTTFELVFTPKK